MFSLAKRIETGAISVIPKKNLLKTNEDINQKDIPKKGMIFFFSQNFLFKISYNSLFFLIYKLKKYFLR